MNSQRELPTPTNLLQQLIRFDTSNPPGGERECALWLRQELAEHGLESEIYHPVGEPERCSLVARVSGRGVAPPLLLQGHLDVVGVHGQRWSHDPFGGQIIEECVWGRGAVDMKGGLVMMVHALLRAHQSESRPPGDIILAAVADEENGGRKGAGFLVREHPYLFDGVKHGLGELGGFTVHIRGHRFYPIMVAEKHICRIQLTFVGAGGHGSQVHRDTALSQAARALRRLDSRRPPFHLVDATKSMLQAMMAEMSMAESAILRMAMNPKTTGMALSLMGKEVGRILEPMFRNTITPTIISGGNQENAVPSEVRVLLDCRLLPGFDAEDIVSDVREIVGNGPELEVTRYDTGPPPASMSLLPYLGELIERADPESNAIPFLVAGGTDAKWFHEVGIDTYGFTPMRLPHDLDFMALFHGADERIPVDALEFGAELMYQVVMGYRG